MKLLLSLFTVTFLCCGWEIYQNQFLGGDFETRNETGYGLGAFSVGASAQASLQDGALCLKLKPGKTSAQPFTILRCKQFPGGTHYLVKAKIRGKGKVSFGFACQFDLEGCGKKEGLWKQSIMLTQDWNHISYDFDFSNIPLDRPLFLVRLLTEGTELFIDDLEILAKWDDAIKISTSPGTLLVPQGETLPEQSYNVYPLNAKGQFLWSDTFREARVFPAETTDGKTSFTLPEPPTPGLHRLILTIGGLSLPRDVLVLPQNQITALKNAAAKSSLKGNVLVLGDSLSDFSRGHNWIDIIQGLLGEKVSFYNLACGGDHCSKLAQRLTAKKAYYRDEMYEDIWSRKYDNVIIFVGQNDTVSFEKDKYAKPQVAIGNVKASFKTVIDEISRHTNAPITIFSGISTPQEVNDKNKATFHYRFGIPAFVEDYNRTVKQICAERGLSYLDIYTPFSGVENKASYFRPDGVHLSIAGHLHLSKIVLEQMK